MALPRTALQVQETKPRSSRASKLGRRTRIRIDEETSRLECCDLCEVVVWFVVPELPVRLRLIWRGWGGEGRRRLETQTRVRVWAEATVMASERKRRRGFLLVSARTHGEVRSCTRGVVMGSGRVGLRFAR